MVYFIQNKDTGHIKIGYTKNNPLERLRTLQASTPSNLELLAFQEGTTTEERNLHIRFKALRLKGEWFKKSDELIEYILSLPKILIEKGIVKVCKKCGKKFEPITQKGVFCSLACRQKDYRKRKNLELEGYRRAVTELSNAQPPKPAEAQPEAPKPTASTTTTIVRGVAWYIKAIREIELDEEYRAMQEMILADKGLTTRQQTDLIQGMKTKSI